MVPTSMSQNMSENTTAPQQSSQAPQPSQPSQPSQPPRSAHPSPDTTQQPVRTAWVRPDFEAYDTAPEVTAYAARD